MRRIPKDLCNRYSFDGNLTNLFTRVVDHVAHDNKDRDLFLGEMISKRFIPAGATLIAGKHKLTPNCSVIGAISDQNKEDKLNLYNNLLMSATGVGIDLSGVKNPVAVLKEFADTALNVKLLWDRPLRGNMAVLSADHPEIDKFIECKVNNKDISIFNISVSATNEFMEKTNNRNTKESKILDMIAEASHKSADPGLVFIDRVQDSGDRIVTCSPCGELFMHDGETCNLGSINLDEFVINGKLDYKLYEKTIRTAVRFLDLVIDKQQIDIPFMKEATTKLRRLGLGVQGFSTMLDSMGIRYQSNTALNLAYELSYLLTKHATAENLALADQHGLETRRNITTTAIPPTGGIRRLVADDGFSTEPKFSETLSIDPYWSIKMVAAWQLSIENAVSKTVNLPEEVSVEDVRNIYKTAYNMGCKGITVYRNNSRSNQPIKCGDGGCDISK